MKANKLFAHGAVFLFLVMPALALAQGSLIPCDGPDCKFKDLVTLANNVIGFLLKIAIPIFAVVFAWAGFLMLTAAGDTGQIKKAKGMMTKAFVGFIAALGAYLLVSLITKVFINKTPTEALPVR